MYAATVHFSFIQIIDYVNYWMFQKFKFTPYLNFKRKPWIMLFFNLQL